MIEHVTYLSAFMVGLLGSTHCLGMCGGISSALSISMQNDSSSKLKKLLYQLNYNLGRISSYMIIGAVAGTLGFSLNHFMGPSGLLVLRVSAGLLLILIGFYLSGWWQGASILETYGLKLWQKISPLTKSFIPITSVRRAFAVGVFWGWLPCGLVYSTVALALTQESSLKGCLLMLCFGLGTLPMMLLLGTTSQSFMRMINFNKVKQATGVLFILFGVWTVIHMLLPLFRQAPLTMACHIS